MKAVEYINNSNIHIVDIQHEFKIFGKPDGENILHLLNNIEKPIVSTLHTVFSNLNEQREKVLSEIVKRSDLLYVFSKEAKNHLIEKYKKCECKIKIIPHGVPSIKFKKPGQIRDRNADIIFVSAGHMRSTKGYELAITALHSLKKEIPNFRYFILGSNHPENETAQSYRKILVDLVAELNLSDQVVFVSDYLEQEWLIKYIQSADICLLPYTSKNQSSSGILSLMIACGRPVISTPFQFANSYITKSMGIISDSFDHFAFAKSIKGLLHKQELWQSISLYNHKVGLEWSWYKVANSYIEGYKKLL
ncbi:glycosyltransferase [Ferruginibacter sp.]|nr:glycosyltransferase [Ferruginibacter sp.]